MIARWVDQHAGGKFDSIVSLDMSVGAAEAHRI